MARKLSYEEIKSYIEGKEGNGCKLLSTVYKNAHEKLLIQCACGEEFEVRFYTFKNGQKQCSKCSIEKRAKKQRNQVIFNCEYCGKEKSVPKSELGKEHNFCSRECYLKWQSKGRIVFNCDYCGKESSTKKYEFEKGKHHFCSQECQYKWRSENIRGKAHYSYNHNISDEERERNRDYPEYNDFKRDVYERDNYTCVCCGDNKGGNLNAHHLNSYNFDKEHRTDINNGVTLCKKCHKEFHDLYGYGNNTKAQFREFLFNKYTQSHDLKFLVLIENIDLTTRAF